MTVSVLGLGAMGARMAQKLLAAGHTVTVWNRTPRDIEGAATAESALEAAAASDVVISMLRDDDASRSVWDDALEGVTAGTTVLEMSTLTPDRARTLGASVLEAGARFLDAPVVGTRPHVEAGILTVLVGGEAGVLEDVRPVLDAFAGTVRHVGPVGAGMAAKLAVNALFAVQAAAVAEMLAALEGEGIAPAEGAALLASMPTASPVAARLGELIAQGATAPNFPVELVAKDLGYAVGLIGAAGAKAHTVQGAADAFLEAERAGFGDLDIAGIIRYVSP